MDVKQFYRHYDRPISSPPQSHQVHVGDKYRTAPYPKHSMYAIYMPTLTPKTTPTDRHIWQSHGVSGYMDHLDPLHVATICDRDVHSPWKPTGYLIHPWTINEFELLSFAHEFLRFRPAGGGWTQVWTTWNAPGTHGSGSH